MKPSRLIATMIVPFLVCVPVFGQFNGQQAVPFGRRGITPGDESGALRTKLAVYDRLLGRGLKNAAAQDAWEIAGIYERRGDYVDAATWYRTSYSQSLVESSKGFVDLILLNKVTIDNPNTIRPFVEIRALCGSHIAREYALANYHETPAQIPDYPSDQKITGCTPVGPGDRMEPSTLIARNRERRNAQMAEFYRQHPDQTPEAKAQQAAAGAAIVLGALIITAAAMPASGPGSIACNKYQNRYPGAYDASVCDTPTK